MMKTWNYRLKEMKPTMRLFFLRQGVPIVDDEIMILYAQIH